MGDVASLPLQEQQCQFMIFQRIVASGALSTKNLQPVGSQSQPDYQNLLAQSRNSLVVMTSVTFMGRRVTQILHKS